MSAIAVIDFETTGISPDHGDRATSCMICVPVTAWQGQTMDC